MWRSGDDCKKSGPGPVMEAKITQLTWLVSESISCDHLPSIAPFDQSQSSDFGISIENYGLDFLAHEHYLFYFGL